MSGQTPSPNETHISTCIWKHLNWNQVLGAKMLGTLNASKRQILTDINGRQRMTKINIPICFTAWRNISLQFDRFFCSGFLRRENFAFTKFSSLIGQLRLIGNKNVLVLQ